MTATAESTSTPTPTLSPEDVECLVGALTDYEPQLRAALDGPSPGPSAAGRLVEALALAQRLRAAILAEQATEPTVTDDQIIALSDEAAAAGDLDQVEVCARALAGEAGARAECQRVIRDAAAA